MNIRSIRSKLATIGSLALLTVIFVSYQNFATPTDKYSLDIISGFDPRLGMVLKEVDARYIRYSQGLNNCTSRSAELELEHKTLKMNLLSVSSTQSHSFLSNAPEVIVSEAVSNRLKSVINRTDRKQIHMIGMYEPQSRSSAPVVVNVSGSGTTELILSSYESVNWVVQDPQNLIRKIYLSSYDPSHVSGLPPNRVEKVEFVSSVYDRASAQFFLDEFMKRRTFGGSCDDYHLASFQGSYSGSVTTPYNILVKGSNPPVPPPPPPPPPAVPGLGTLQILTGRTIVKTAPYITRGDAEEMCRLYLSVPASNFNCTWNTMPIVNPRPPVPPPPPSLPPPVPSKELGWLNFHVDSRLLYSQQMTKVEAYEFCKVRASSSRSFYSVCTWNGVRVY